VSYIKSAVDDVANVATIATARATTRRELQSSVSESAVSSVASVDLPDVLRCGLYYGVGARAPAMLGRFMGAVTVISGVVGCGNIHAAAACVACG
jgi:hypothetical protein